MLEKVEFLKKLEKEIPVKTFCEYYGIRSSTAYDLKKQRQQMFKGRFLSSGIF